MNTKKIIAVFVALLALSACSGTKEKLGLTKKPPDEFAIVKRAPLSMPPDYALRPPEPGAPRPQEQETSVEARDTVFGQTPAADQKAPVPRGEDQNFLMKAGAGQADPAIRQEVDAETAKIAASSVPVAKKILSFGAKPKLSDAPASVVNAKKESARIQQNKATGQPVTTGATPSIEK